MSATHGGRFAGELCRRATHLRHRLCSVAVIDLEKSASPSRGRHRRGSEISLQDPHGRNIYGARMGTIQADHAGARLRARSDGHHPYHPQKFQLSGENRRCGSPTML